MLVAPAKLNLVLEILGRRKDGFHQIRGIAQTIGLADILHFQQGNRVEFSCSDPNWISSRSLVSRAVSLLQKTTASVRGTIIEVEKHIPLLSGLGGDSSDAAAALRGLNQLWELGLSTERLRGLASRLSSDVALFLYGGTVLLEGRGEMITPLSPFPHRWVVLMVPPLPRVIGKTAQAYRQVVANDYTGGQITDSFIAELTRSEGASFSLFNVFDNIAPASFPGLKSYWQQFQNAGAEEIHLAGSGPALFTLVKDKARAEGIYWYLQKQGLESYLTETSTN
ncbi:MAG: 4-(cytidine 5'-diphospho)-2-C-methyl-D-erythritol kinase [Dehalococcoidales bacterium]|nr:4-(cytidine 5'-diphospho)-2-C-methyl-D-erythritol kinase [Dehalococcoidales bacterium]